MWLTWCWSHVSLMMSLLPSSSSHFGEGRNVPDLDGVNYFPLTPTSFYQFRHIDAPWTLPIPKQLRVWKFQLTISHSYINPVLYYYYSPSWNLMETSSHHSKSFYFSGLCLAWIISFPTWSVSHFINICSYVLSSFTTQSLNSMCP